MKKHAIITGAAGNLGRAVTNALLDEGYNVNAIISHRDNTGYIRREGLSVFQADLMSENETLTTINFIIKGIESIDLTMMTVGGFAPGKLQEVILTDIEKMYRLNFVTAFNVVRAVFPFMEKQKNGGKLVFIGALPAIQPEQAIEMVAYALSKSLLFRLSEIINEAGKEKNIRSVVVVPGTIDTPRNRTSMPDEDFTKWVKPEEIARRIVKLVSSSDMKAPDNIMKIYSNY
jgi:NAD(P)-dependent dehydrogenase (short-subunit alcohol dehydrogenase family)